MVAHPQDGPGYSGISVKIELATLNLSAVLARHTFFQEAPSSVVDRLAKHARGMQCSPGQLIFRKGDQGSGLFAVLSGVVKISVPSPDGRELVLRLVGPQDGVFGEVALLDGGPRTADAVAAENCDLLFLDRRDFVAVVKDEPSFAIKLLALVTDRLRQTSEQVEELTFLGPPVRLARALLRLARLQGTEFAEKPRVKITQKELGQTVGLSRETTNKFLNEWALNGTLALEKGGCTILDPFYISAIAGSEK
jgi:CRP/FNR family cyclic AMP-dependent transcriptional regulator